MVECPENIYMTKYKYVAEHKYTEIKFSIQYLHKGPKFPKQPQIWAKTEVFWVHNTFAHVTQLL